LLALARRPNVAVKGTGQAGYALDPYPFRSIHDALHRVFDAFGPRRMFWGTDITRMHCTWRQCVTLFTEELPWLHGADLDLGMGQAFCDWIDFWRVASAVHGGRAVDAHPPAGKLAPVWGQEIHAPDEAIIPMMKLFHTPASPFVRKCSVAIRELGLEDRVEVIPTKWPHSWGTETVPYREDFLAATPIARITALVTEDGERLTESSLICEYLNDELGDYRLCPQSGRERWKILSVVSVATSGIMECQVMRRTAAVVAQSAA
jgi:hypothetical protein